LIFDDDQILDKEVDAIAEFDLLSVKDHR